MGQLHILLLILAVSRYADSKGGGGGGTSPVKITESGKPALETEYHLTCKFNQLKVEGVIWEKDGNLLYVDYNLKWQNSAFTVVRGVGEVELHFEDMHIHHAGKYRCLVVTEDHRDYSVVKDVVIPPETIIVRPHENHRLHCTEDLGKDLSSAVWIKGNEIISVNTTITFAHTHKHSNYSYYKLDAMRNLYIHNATSENMGQYDCYVNGQKVNSVTLAFPAPPPGEPALSGAKGIAFGVALGVIILAILGMAVYLQKTV